MKTNLSSKSVLLVLARVKCISNQTFKGYLQESNPRHPFGHLIGLV